MVGTQRLKLAGLKGGGLKNKIFEPSKHRFSVRKESREKGFYKALTVEFSSLVLRAYIKSVGTKTTILTQKINAILGSRASI